MSRILVLGAAPLPFEFLDRQYAANLRTWHFTQPLVADGHEVRLVASRLPNTCPADMEAVQRTVEKGFEYFSVEGDLFQDPAFLQKHCDDFDPDAIVGVNTHPASRAAHIETDKPIWCDLNGWVMAEAQTKTFVYDDDRYLSHFWNMERAVLDRADVISTVSVAQAHATVGELAVRGRLGRKTFGYNFVHRIPNAVPEVEYKHSSRVARGVLVPEDTFIVLWVGGYNTWTHVDLLYEALTRAMEKVEHLHFVSTGGVIEGHDDLTFARFRQMASAGPFADRFHFVGWVPTADVPCYYFESDLGINVDRHNYETVFGARNRLNDMMKAGLPVLTTTGTEISQIIAENELGLVAPTGDATAYADRIVWAARHAGKLKALGHKAQAYVFDHFSYARTTEALRSWVHDPYRAPDAGRRVEFENIDFFKQTSEPETGDSELSSLRLRAKPKIHAVVVHHRGKDMLGQCLESLLDSAHVDLEIIVFLNCCQENVPNIVDTSAHVHRVTSETSLGFSHANNLGVAWARDHLGEPDFYYFINNDTVSLPQSLACLAENLQRRPSAAMAGPKLLILGAPNHYNSLGLNVTEDAWGWDEAIGQRVEDYSSALSTRDVLSVTGSALLIDAALFHRIGGWTEVYDYYFEDIDLGIKVWKNGHKVIHVPDAVVLHQISATMTEGSERKFFFFWRNRLILALVHWPLGLLLRTFYRAFFGEIFDRRRTDHTRLRKAMIGALRKLPSLMRCRFSFRGNTYWRRFLVPPGSVPVISLPEIDPAKQKTVKELIDLVGNSFLGYPKPQGLEQQFAEALEKAAEIEASYQEARFELDKIHASKMWSLWMMTIGLRRLLKSPFTGLRSLFSRG